MTVKIFAWEVNVTEQSTVAFQVFHDVAYKAKDRNDLVAGIDEFLDQVTVLPPGEWDPSIRIEPPKNVPSQVNVRGCRNVEVYFSKIVTRCIQTGDLCFSD